MRESKYQTDCYNIIHEQKVWYSNRLSTKWIHEKVAVQHNWYLLSAT